MTKDQMMRFRGALQAKRQELVSAIRAHTGGFATLARRGCHARSTASGKDALEMLRRYSFDLIILDAHLPDMQGAEIAMAVRSGVFTTGATIRVISSDDGSDNVLLLRNAEVDEFIAKPVAANKLRDRLEHWLHSSSRGVNPNGTSRGGECG